MAHPASLLLVLLLAFQTVYCEEYLVAMAKTFKTAHLSVTTGHKNGSIEFKLPESKESETVEIPPYSRHLVTVGQRSQPGVDVKGVSVDDKAFVVKTSDDSIAISGNYRYATFSILPVSALGTKYMLPFCGVNQKKSFIVIASYDQQTEVNITLRLNAERFLFNWKQYDDGQIITQTLKPCQTFMFTYERNLTGTVIQASHPIAVFMGSSQTFDVETYEQIPPVSAYGTEYVVAAVDTPEDHKLQIISAEYDNEIHFSDGRVVSSRFYSDFLQGNDTLYFTSTKPVMTTLCRLRKYRYNSGLVVVPPVSSYRNQEISLSVPNSTVKILTKASANVIVQRSSREMIPAKWSPIPGSDYQVGTCMIPNDNATTFNSNDNFGLLAFSENFIQNGDYNKPSGKEIPDPGEEYLIALAKTDRTAYITATTGQEQGWVKYKLANSTLLQTLQVIPFSRKLITIDQNSLAGIGVENKSVVIHASNRVSITGCYRYAAFAPLPVSALGTKYILPFCGVTGRKSVLVIAAHKHEADVSIRLRLKSMSITHGGMEYVNDKVMTQHLRPYQTFSFTFEPDVTGTVVESTYPIAVFLGSIYGRQIDTYDQLPPVSAFGDEYVVALEDDREPHTLQITSAYNDTHIYFSDGSDLSGPILNRTFRGNDTIYFHSNRPVMATLCRRSRMVYYSAFVVVPPISSYMKRKISLYIPYSKVKTSVKLITKTDATVQISRYTEQEVPTHWREIPGSLYKVVTCTIPNKYATSFSANDSFTLLAFSYYFVQNGGYRVKNQGTEVMMSAGMMTDNVSAEVSTRFRHLLLVSIMCGLVILALVIVIAAVAVRMRMRRGARGDPGAQARTDPVAIEMTARHDPAAAEEPQDTPETEETPAAQGPSAPQETPATQEPPESPEAPDTQAVEGTHSA